VDEPSVEAPAVRVELFEDRCAVTRELEVSEGRQAVRIGPLSPLIRAEAVAFVGGTAVLVEDVEVVRAHRLRSEADPAELEALREQESARRDEAEQAEDAARRADDRVARAQATLTAASKAAPAALQAGESPRRLLAAVRSLAEAHRASLDEAHEARQGLARAQAAHQSARLALDALRAGTHVEQAWLHVRLVASESGAARLRYVLPCALWRPVHRAELHDDTVRWEVQAAAWNATGEDWEGVELVCSTARPGERAEPPTLNEDRVQLQRRDAELVVEARDEEVTVARDGERAVSSTLPGVDDGGETRVYVAPSPVTLPSTGRPSFVSLAQLEMLAERRWEAVPERGAAVVLRTRHAHRDHRPLLAGPVHLVRDGEAVGRTQIELVPPGEPFSLGWGSHDHVRVVRRTDHRTDRTLLRGTHVHTFDTRLRIRHLGDEMLTLHVTERVPVSELSEVSVSVEDATPAAEGPDRDGFLRWELVLHPGDQQTVTVTTQVRAASRVALPF
jgi:uncharacterized protein (TIGR02231 family)